MEFSSLPDDCLRLILQQLEIEHILPLKVVSKRFHDLIKHILATKRILKIFGSYYEFQRFNQTLVENYVDNVPDFNLSDKTDVLIIKNSESESVYQIPESFPNVIIVMINCRSFSGIDLARFLEPWRAQIVSYGMFALPKSLDDTNRVWETVNQMTSLRKLHLIIPTQYRLPDHFPIISQLQIFSLVNYPNNDLVPIFAQISSKILIILSNVLFGPNQLEELIKLNPLVPQRVFGIDYGYMLAKENRVENYKKLFHLTCEKFTEIELMDLMFGEHIPLMEIMPSLSKLKKLKSLSIYIGKNQLPTNFSAIYSLPRIPLENLHIEFFDLSFKQFWQIIGLFGPNIKELRLKHDFVFFKPQEKETFVSRLRREFPMMIKLTL